MLSADLLRRLDRWLGLPLVWLLGGLRLLLRRRGAPRGERDGALLVVQLSEMGSVILAEPALRELATAWPRYHFLILERNAACLALLPHLPTARVFVLRDRSLWTLALDSLRFLRWSRRQRLAAVLDLELFSRFSVLLATLSGAPRRVGFAHPGEGLSQGGLLTEPVAYNPHRHMSANYRALVQRLLRAAPVAIAADPAPPRVTPFPARPHEEQRIRARLAALFPPAGRARRLVLVQVGASAVLPQRNWPPSLWRAALAELLEDPALQLLLCGRASEWAAAEALRQQLASPRCANGCGLFQVAELPHLYRVAELLLAADSGPAHFAAVTELPVVVLFGPETPQLFQPLGRAEVLYAGLACSPCVSAANHRFTRCRNNRCMRAIPPAALVAAARRQLYPATAERRA